MATKKGNNMQNSREEKRYRTWNTVLYRDSEIYDFDIIIANIIENVQKYYIIEHQAEDDTKKNHFHVTFRLENAKTRSAVSKFIGVPENYFEPTIDTRSAVRYQLHLDHPTKKQYSKDDIITNDKDTLEKYLINDNSEGLIVMELLSKLDEGYSFRRILQWACEKNYYSEFRRNFNILHTIITDERKKKL